MQPDQPSHDKETEEETRQDKILTIQDAWAALRLPGCHYYPTVWYAEAEVNVESRQGAIDALQAFAAQAKLEAEVHSHFPWFPLKSRLTGESFVPTEIDRSEDAPEVDYCQLTAWSGGSLEKLEASEVEEKLRYQNWAEAATKLLRYAAIFENVAQKHRPIIVHSAELLYQSFSPEEQEEYYRMTRDETDHEDGS